MHRIYVMVQKIYVCFLVYGPQMFKTVVLDWYTIYSTCQKERNCLYRFLCSSALLKHPRKAEVMWSICNFCSSVLQRTFG